jgi:hypothetical protein
VTHVGDVWRIYHEDLLEMDRAVAELIEQLYAAEQHRHHVYLDLVRQPGELGDSD